ncbi:NADH-quinone oxidoreductase subunit J [Bacillus sp. MUM 13]|uniref:NADH-quinone oxidoreductase subunit J n=1 Tax=Bacillus sp. MUM 13 TaxID=1678001 RepID=UPI0008F577FA|nr:NADH-quinone oxidoreductase subunit J [Bacillus sp. MUM 13]OIK12588.1 NADH:ubiquinone oxidoreductase subunit J [Bacillus sp. MUM 13]
MSLSGELAAFIVLAIIAVGGGVFLINLTKVVHMVAALVFSFISIAGIYILLSAEFVASVQILIYSGAVTIIMLFGIMLTRHNDAEVQRMGKGRKILLLFSLAGFAFAVYMGIYRLEIPAQPNTLHISNTEQIGKALYSKNVIPFEITSVLLLVALVGAIVLARKDEEEKEDAKS